MPVHEYVSADSGYRYQAVTVEEWSGIYGANLRESGYRYCGFGPGGVYVAAPGEPCEQAPTLPGLEILPPPLETTIAPPGVTTGGVGSAPAPVKIGCGTCGRPSATTAAAPPAQPPAQPVVVLAGIVAARWPWWVFVLGLVLLAAIVKRDDR